MSGDHDAGNGSGRQDPASVKIALRNLPFYRSARIATTLIGDLIGEAGPVSRRVSSGGGGTVGVVGYKKRPFPDICWMPQPDLWGTRHPLRKGLHPQTLRKTQISDLFQFGADTTQKLPDVLKSIKRVLESRIQIADGFPRNQRQFRTQDAQLMTYRRNYTQQLRADF